MTLLEDCLGLNRVVDKSAKRDQDQLEFLTSMYLHAGGIALVKGALRGGKTTWMVFMAYIRRKLFGYPVVSNVLLRPAFGDYYYLDTEALVEEFLKVNATVKKEVARQKSGKLSERDKLVARSAWEGSKVNLYKSTIIWDEGYGSLDRRRSHSPKLLLLSYMVQQWGHLESLILIGASSEKLLDDIRINPVATHEVNCGHYPTLGISTYDVLYRYAPTRVGINPLRMTLEIDNWAGKNGLFDSGCPVAVDPGILKAVLRECKM